MQYKCKSCGANVEVENSKENAVCKYCGTVSTVSSSIANTKRVAPPSHKRVALHVENAQTIILCFIFFPIAAVLFFLGLAFGFGDNDFDMLIGFLVAALIVGGIPFVLKSNAVVKRMKKQLYSDGFEIVSYFSFISNSPNYSHNYFVISKNQNWIIWQQNGTYDIYSKSDVSKCEEIIRKDRNSQGVEVCSLLKLIITFTNGNNAVEISFITPDNNSGTAQSYMADLQKSKEIKAFFDSENIL